MLARDPPGRAEPRLGQHGRARAVRYAAPPEASAGKNFSSVQPASSAASDLGDGGHAGQEGQAGVGHGRQQRRRSRRARPGTAAPAAAACRAWAGVGTVPTPTRISGTSAAIRRIGLQRDRRAQGQLDHRQPAGDEGAGERHGAGSGRRPRRPGPPGTRSSSDSDVAGQCWTRAAPSPAGRCAGGCGDRRGAGRSRAPASAGPTVVAERGEQLAPGAGPRLGREALAPVRRALASSSASTSARRTPALGVER